MVFFVGCIGLNNDVLFSYCSLHSIKKYVCKFSISMNVLDKEKEPSNTTSLDSLFVTSGFGNVNYQMPLINNRRPTEHKTKES